jgi:hypothetical protein
MVTDLLYLPPPPLPHSKVKGGKVECCRQVFKYCTARTILTVFAIGKQFWILNFYSGLVRNGHEPSIMPSDVSLVLVWP